MSNSREPSLESAAALAIVEDSDVIDLCSDSSDDTTTHLAGKASRSVSRDETLSLLSLSEESDADSTAEGYYLSYTSISCMLCHMLCAALMQEPLPYR